MHGLAYVEDQYIQKNIHQPHHMDLYTSHNELGDYQLDRENYHEDW